MTYLRGGGLSEYSRYYQNKHIYDTFGSESEWVFFRTIRSPRVVLRPYKAPVVTCRHPFRRWVGKEGHSCGSGDTRRCDQAVRRRIGGGEGTLLNCARALVSCYVSLCRTTMPRERTFIMIKPDGVQRGLVGQSMS